MLEKIGLPAKPSQRGNNWVVDASNCQGCSSQFTFINRKHHCRRCGGLFCSSCTSQRMVLRGQGDSPVRICEPCKQLEEAARFEMRYGHRNKAGKVSSILASKHEDELLKQILSSNDGKEGSSSSARQCNIDTDLSIKKESRSSSFSTAHEVACLDGREEIRRTHSVDETGSTSPEELRQRALDEKKKYKILKGEGKSDDALRAFKRAKELERQADALEMSIRRNRKKVLPSGNAAQVENKDASKGSGRKSKLLTDQGKDDLTAELRELGWSDADIHEGGKKSANISLEGELSSLLGDISQRTNKDTGTRGIDNSQVIAHKRKALALKREGKLADAKEELKKAKILEKQLEEQDLLGFSDDSDDEISALIRSMDDDKQHDLLIGHEQEHTFDFDQVMGTADDFGVDSNFEVTDEDLIDPELAATLKSLGWNDDFDNLENVVTQTAPVDKEVLQTEILSLKREALNQKRAGNIAEAMAQLKKAKLLEKDLESLEGKFENLVEQKPTIIQKGSSSQNVNAKHDADSKLAPKSRLVIQKDLLSLKKRALALRREGRLDEAEEELKKGSVLEQQLEEMDDASRMKTTRVTSGSKDLDLEYDHPDFPGNPPDGEGEDDITDQDMHDPTYLSVLRNLGWKDEDDKTSKTPKENIGHSTQTMESSVTQVTSNFPSRRSRRSKAELQRELLGLKRKALALRREGKTDEAEEVLRTAKSLESEMAEIEAPKKDIQLESNRSGDEIIRPHKSAAMGGDVQEDVTDKDMHDPAPLSMLKNIGWNNEEIEPINTQGKPYLIQSSSSASVATQKSKREIQPELLDLKRKALALRRKGEIEEAEELMRRAEVLEAQMEEIVLPKKELPDTAKDVKYGSSESGFRPEKQGVVKSAEEMSGKVVIMAQGSDRNMVESFMDLGQKQSNVSAPPLKCSDGLLPVSSQLIEDKDTLLGDLVPEVKRELVGNARPNEVNGSVPLHHQSVNKMDLLTGDHWTNSYMAAERPEDNVSSGSVAFIPFEPHVQVLPSKTHIENLRNNEDQLDFHSDASSLLPDSHVQVSSLTRPFKNLSKEDLITEKGEETFNADKKPHTTEMKSAQGLDPQNSQNSLRQEVLAHKRKAVALKREGKLTEAREELRQAKILEKSLDQETPESETGKDNVLTSVSNASVVQQKESNVSNIAPKPLSSRDRFKLQQESLGHKRQALKLRREGRMEEAEAEFELAKGLEAQLEESASQDHTKSKVAEPLDDVVVEDLLDPQLRVALKAIGIDDAVASQGPQRGGPVKGSPGKSENVSQERIQLEERVKAEKVKAVNLKRSGKQAEALDALRRAKLYEKKLNSLTTSN